MSSKLPHAVYGLVEGHWFWAIWDSEQDFWECMKTKVFRAACGIDATLLNVLSSVKSRMPENAKWQRDDFFAGKACEYYRSSRQSGSTDVQVVHNSTASVHIELIEQERLRREAESQRQIDQTVKNVAELNDRIAECLSQIEQYRRKIKSLESQHAFLLKQKSGRSWIKKFLLEKEADAIVRLQVGELNQLDSANEFQDR
jgi:hypothetical protein